jgi:hypothetical protein
MMYIHIYIYIYMYTYIEVYMYICAACEILGPKVGVYLRGPLKYTPKVGVYLRGPLKYTDGPGSLVDNTPEPRPVGRVSGVKRPITKFT